jgi:hypothetical protein
MQAECDKKKKPYPKSLLPLSTNEVIKAALKNLENFKTKSIAKVSIYNFFAKELLTNQERLVITQVFKTLDAEGDGILTVKEVVKAYFKYCNDSRSKIISESKEHEMEDKFTKIFRQINCMDADE